MHLEMILNINYFIRITYNLHFKVSHQIPTTLAICTCEAVTYFSLKAEAKKKKN